MNIFYYRSRAGSLVLVFGLMLAILLILTGCGPSDDPGSNKATIQVTVWDDQTQRPVDRAEVFLSLPGQIFPVEYTDTVGRALFEVDKELLEGISELVIQKEGYQRQTHNLMLSNAPLFQTYLVPIGATAVPRETPSSTPIPPSPLPDATVAPTLTQTAVPSNTPTATSAPTNTPMNEVQSDVITLTRREGAETVFVLAGPDISNVQLGTLGSTESAEVIGRTEQNEWLQVITERNVQGWVANCEVELSSPNLNDIAVTWSGAVTAKNCSVGNSGSNSTTILTSSSSCVNVTYSRTDWPSKEFDDILLSWSNVPSSATRLKLWVTGPTNSGGAGFVVDPTFSDTDTSYKVELFMFEDGDFRSGATYTYVVQPFNAEDEIICSTQGTFIP